MTAKEAIVKYLASRKTPASAKEIATFAKLNYNTVRRILGEMAGWAELTNTNVRCKVDKTYRTGYSLA